MVAPIRERFVNLNNNLNNLQQAITREQATDDYSTISAFRYLLTTCDNQLNELREFSENYAGEINGATRRIQEMRTRIGQIASRILQSIAQRRSREIEELKEETKRILPVQREKVSEIATRVENYARYTERDLPEGTSMQQISDKAEVDFTNLLEINEELTELKIKLERFDMIMEDDWDFEQIFNKIGISISLILSMQSFTYLSKKYGEIEGELTALPNVLSPEDQDKAHRLMEEIEKLIPYSTNQGSFSKLNQEIIRALNR